MKLNQVLFRLERKFGKYAVPNLMQIIVIGMAVVYVIDLVIAPAKGVYFSDFISFDRDLVFKGQIWRLLSFVIMPTELGSPLFVIFALYFYWLIGNTLEGYWGTFKFNIYYLCGVIGTVAGGMLTGYATNHFLNLSLFIAFAAIAPNFQILLFFFIPIKIKYLAMFDGLILILQFAIGSFGMKIAVLMSIANLILFFGGDFINNIKRFIDRKKSNMRFEKAKKEFNRTRNK